MSDDESKKLFVPTDSSVSSARGGLPQPIEDKQQSDPDQINYQIEELRKQRVQLLAQVQNHIDKLGGEKQPTILDALKDFQSFFHDYTNYFFDEEKQEAFSQQKTTYARILTTALDNTRLSWSTLSLAINQRFNPVYAERLTQIDQVGKALLEKSGLLVKTDPIIYFDKIYHITRFPYQIHPLLGIPLDRFDSDDPTTIAHEIGHHIFWNRGELEEYTERMQLLREGIVGIIFKSDQLSLDRQDLEQSEKQVKAIFDKFHIWMAWREEAFADIVGTLLTGPRYAKSAQDILVRERLGDISNLLQHDDEHPMPALRPFLASTTLRIIAEQLKNEQPNDHFGAQLTQFVEQLEDRWRPFWEASVQFETGNQQEQDSSAISTMGLRDYLLEIVRMILNTKLFPADNGSAGDRTTLLERVAYWGKDRSIEHLQELQTLSENLDPLTIPPISTTEVSIPANALEDPSDQPFPKLLNFVNAQRQKRKEEGKRITTQEWQDILFLDLALGRDHSDCRQDHSHSWTLRHYHSGYVRVLC